MHLLELWRNFICGNETGSPGRTVSLHPTRSGSQSEHRTRRILPARGTCHITITLRNASVNSSGAHPPPGQPRGICSNVCPGGGALAILSQPGGWALAYPGATPGHLSVFEYGRGKDEDFVKDWLVRHGLEKLVDVFKSMFSQF